MRPQGGTPTAARLNGILRPYLKLVEEKGSDAVKPLNVIVITDGVASDDVETVILNAAKKLDKYDAPGWQVGIQFFQVGREPGAAAALRELDDELSEDGLRDIVDTVPWRGEEGTVLNADGILKVCLLIFIKVMTWCLLLLGRLFLELCIEGSIARGTAWTGYGTSWWGRSRSVQNVACLQGPFLLLLACLLILFLFKICSLLIEPFSLEMAVALKKGL